MPSRGVLQAAFFDFDGTLANSYPAITASVNHVRAAHALPPLEESAVRRYVGRGLAFLLRDTVPGTNITADSALYHAHHPTVLQSGTRLLPGVAESLETLANLGIRLAVCSNKPVALTRLVLGYLGLTQRFEAVLGPEDVARPKPSPDMLLAGLERLGVAKEEAIYVGDMVVDIETARGAGVAVWVVPTGSDDQPTLAAAKPDRLLRDFAELVEHCTELRKQA